MAYDPHDILACLVFGALHFVPAVAEDKVVGIVTGIDVLALHLGEADAMTDDLMAHIHGTYSAAS